MSRIIAQVTLQRDTMLAEDVATNTMHFEDDSPSVDQPGDVGNGNIDGLALRIDQFYKSIGQYLSSTLTGTGTIRFYDFDAGFGTGGVKQGRIPVEEKPVTFTPATTSLPGECALVLSMRAEPLAGAVPGRRRGRIFLGPLALAATQNVITGEADPRPADTVLGAILTAGRTMARGAAGTYRLAVYSPTIMAATNDPGQAFSDVNELWMDNAMDTIRSRGARRTKRFRVDLDNADTYALFA